MEPTTYSNQRQITIHKCDKKDGYTKLDRKANVRAMRALGYSAYMLYMRLCMNATDFKMILSKVSVCDETSLTKNTYYDAFAKLVEKGYLVQRPNTKCLYDFYEDPDLGNAHPKNGEVRTGKQKSKAPKRVENIKKYGNIEAREGADALPPGDKDKKIKDTVDNKKRVFADI